MCVYIYIYIYIHVHIYIRLALPSHLTSSTPTGLPRLQENAHPPRTPVGP